jgi:hypothetical protein
MKARILISALTILAVAGVAFAGSPDKMAGKDMKAHMEMMKAEMTKCAVCKNMLTHMDQYGPTMKSEVIKMNAGMGMMHMISDPKMVAVYQQDCDATAKAGMACVEMTDEQAKTDLCQFCQELRGIAKAGGTISNGHTSNGSILVVMSDKPELQTRINTLATKCEAMMASN